MEGNEPTVAYKQIFAVSCPQIYPRYANERSVEMLIAFENGVPTGIMCPDYKEDGTCKRNDDKPCDYTAWKKINKPDPASDKQ